MSNNADIEYSLKEEIFKVGSIGSGSGGARLKVGRLSVNSKKGLNSARSRSIKVTSPQNRVSSMSHRNLNIINTNNSGAPEIEEPDTFGGVAASFKIRSKRSSFGSNSGLSRKKSLKNPKRKNSKKSVLNRSMTHSLKSKSCRNSSAKSAKHGSL